VATADGAAESGSTGAPSNAALNLSAIKATAKTAPLASKVIRIIMRTICAPHPYQRVNAR
jgi:hypothetical protein